MEGLGAGGHERHAVHGFFRRTDIHEVPGQPVPGLLFPGLSQGAPERLLVRWGRSRPVCQVSIRHVRRHEDSRRAGIGRTVCRARDGPRVLFLQYFRPVPARPFPGAGMGARPRIRRGLATDQRIRYCRECSRAVEYNSARRRWKEPAAAAVPGGGVGHAADSYSETASMTWLRADLHVHTCHSRQTGDLTFLRSRDCYSKPEEVYRVAKSRGMDLVAITDHDTIDGALELLDHLPGAEDVIVGEEVSCRFPDGNVNVHFGVYGMTEALHRELQPLRRN